VTEQERLKIKDKLIEFGFWGGDEPGDPTSDSSALTVLLGAMKRRLEPNAYLSYTVSLLSTQSTEVHVNLGEQKYRLATDTDLYAAICEAALALPSFLRSFPEFAANETDN
jgi:hypothetical protein